MGMLIVGLVVGFVAKWLVGKWVSDELRVHRHPRLRVRIPDHVVVADRRRDNVLQFERPGRVSDVGRGDRQRACADDAGGAA